MGYGLIIVDEGDLDSDAVYFGVNGFWWPRCATACSTSAC